MSNEAKVGAFTLVGLCLLVGIVIYLSGYSFVHSNDYKFDIMFNRVVGLKPGANVSYAGINAGKVVAIRSEDGKARIAVKIHEDIKIDKKSTFTINSDGLMGEKFVDIQPPKEASGEFVSSGDIIEGIDERGLDYLFSQAGATMTDLQQLIQSMNGILGNKDVQDSMIQTSINLKNLTGNMNEIMQVLANMAVNDQQDMDAIIKNLAAMTNSMAQAADKADGILGDLETSTDALTGDGAVVNNLRATIANFAQTSETIKNMAQNMEPLASPENRQKIENIINNADAISTKADTMMDRVSNIETKAGVEAMYSGGKSDWAVNADLRVYSDPNSFLLIGADDIGGDDSGTNLQIGTGNGYVTGRGGLIDDKVGVGVDVKAGDKAMVSVDAYDPDDLRVKVKGQYEISDGTYLVGQVKDVNNSDDRATYMGIRHEF